MNAFDFRRNQRTMHEEEDKSIFCFLGGHFQTILGSLMSFEFPPKATTEYVHLPDEDILTMEVSTPKHWKEDEPTVVLLHGLCGSHNSNYLRRLTKKLTKDGFKVVRLNMRGCGSGKGLAKNIYHCGSSDDVRYQIQGLKKKFPSSEITLIGFSLGGNIVLKLIGELGDRAKELFKYVIAVSPPADLKNSVRLMGSPKNLMYERYFIRLLRQHVHYRHWKFKLPKIHLPPVMTLFEFDEYYVAPELGYKSALDYYDDCSAIKVLKEIKIPCHILFSKDDPIIDANAVDNLNLPDNIKVFKAQSGGHLGFLANPLKKQGFHWMDFILLKWIRNMHHKDAA